MLQPLSFHTKANLEKKLSFDISFKLLAEPKWHCDTQSLNQIINVSLTTFLRCIGSALAKSINPSTSGYLYCMLFSSCDMLVKTSPCTVPGKHFSASSSLIFASTLMASWTHFSYVNNFQ